MKRLVTGDFTCMDNTVVELLDLFPFLSLLSRRRFSSVV